MLLLPYRSACHNRLTGIIFRAGFCQTTDRSIIMASLFSKNGTIISLFPTKENLEIKIPKYQRFNSCLATKTNPKIQLLQEVMRELPKVMLN